MTGSRSTAGTREQRAILTLALQFIALTAIITVSASFLVRSGEAIAQHTGLGRGWVGVVFLATATSMPELATGLSAAGGYGFVDIAAGDVFGSCMFNLLILGVLDAWSGSPLTTRAHQGHVITGGLSIILLGICAIALVARTEVPVIGWVSLASVAILLVYGSGILVIRADEKHRVPILADAETPLTLRRALLIYAAAAVVVIAAAIALPGIAVQAAEAAGLSQTFVGTFFVAIATSLPEVVTSVAALRLGAVDMLFGNLFGSNLFNIVILAIDDMVYRDGALLAAADSAHIIPLAAATMMTATALIGLTYRTQLKRAPLAWDSMVMVLTFVGSAALLARLSSH